MLGLKSAGRRSPLSVTNRNSFIPELWKKTDATWNPGCRQVWMVIYSVWYKYQIGSIQNAEREWRQMRPGWRERSGGWGQSLWWLNDLPESWWLNCDYMRLHALTQRDRGAKRTHRAGGDKWGKWWRGLWHPPPPLNWGYLKKKKKSLHRPRFFGLSWEKKHSWSSLQMVF